MFGGHCLRLKKLGTLYPHIGKVFFIFLRGEGTCLGVEKNRIAFLNA